MVVGINDTLRAGFAPQRTGQSVRDEMLWMATKGTKWFLRRSVDLIPYLLLLAAREALICPKDWLAATDAEVIPAPDWLSALPALPALPASREEAEPAID